MLDIDIFSPNQNELNGIELKSYFMTQKAKSNQKRSKLDSFFSLFKVWKNKQRDNMNNLSTLPIIPVDLPFGTKLKYCRLPTHENVLIIDVHGYSEKCIAVSEIEYFGVFHFDFNNSFFAVLAIVFKKTSKHKQDVMILVPKTSFDKLSECERSYYESICYLLSRDGVIVG